MPGGGIRKKQMESAARGLLRERTLCLLPWSTLHVGTDGKVVPCCNWAGPSLGDARTSSVAELWNAAHLKALRAAMLDGRPTAGCLLCHEAERSGFRSIRQQRSAELSRHRGRIALTRKDGGLPVLPFPLLEIRLSNVCNLRCRTCGPTLSSAWAPDAHALGLPVGDAIVRSYGDWQAFWGQWGALIGPELEEIVFAGGESILMEEHYRILDFLLEHGLEKVRLRYVTNFSNLRFRGRDVLDLWTRFSDVEIVASLDDSGGRGEYLRKGLRWDDVLANREELRRRCPSAVFHVSATLSVFNAAHLPDFHLELMRGGLVERNLFRINLLLVPDIYRAQILPEPLKRKVLDAYRGHAEALALAGDRAAEDFRIAMRFVAAKNLSGLLPRFAETTRRLDRIRGEDVRRVFPELAPIFTRQPGG